MKIYFDENFPYQIAKALTILEEPSQEVVTVLNVSEEFGRGAQGVGQVERRLGRDASFASNELIETGPGPADPLGKCGLTEAHRLKELLEQDLAGMEGILWSSVHRACLS